MDGPASSTSRPSSSRIARTRPYSKPHRTMSPLCRVPSRTRTVATGPRPLSRKDSMTAPLAIPLRTAFSSRTSACSRIASSRSSMPVPAFAETWTNWLSPPHSSGRMPYWDSSFFTRSGSASGLSILFTATTTGTCAALACWIASIVCGITPSSAATTRTTISVACAPRARMEVNAAWPGVSRKVIMPLSVSTW